MALRATREVAAEDVECVARSVRRERFTSKTLDFSVHRTESSELTLPEAKVNIGTRPTNTEGTSRTEKANLMINRGKARNGKN